MITIGQSSIVISPIMMGLWQADIVRWPDSVEKDIIAAINAATEAGINSFDTAFAYGNGASERLLGKTLKHKRPEVVYASKIFCNKLRYQQVIASCENSLKNLQTDYIDLLQVHWPSGYFGTAFVPIEETMRALENLKATGKIRAIGVSNFTLAELQEAQQYVRIDSLQSSYSLFWRYIEKDLQTYCQQHDITLLAYSSLAQGLLTGKYGIEISFKKHDVRNDYKVFQGEFFHHALAALEKLRPIADRYQITLGQLALFWIISHENTAAIVGARHSQQASENAQAMHVKLALQDLAEVDAIGLEVARLKMDEMHIFNIPNLSKRATSK